ncbi:hypothetical protein QWZ13_19030 [Reinekea marina]|uniref:hypothetical protein n=1 Tax=Reinekea marina TaxID=1310421 RepID=UPI0025B2F137|nr:hypothetical protein [Reinekea marina]MDN3651008.1 hypothetical protein [Reinekea marina]
MPLNFAIHGSDSRAKLISHQSFVLQCVLVYLTVQHQRWLRRKINLSRSLKHIHVPLNFAIHGSDSRAKLISHQSFVLQCVLVYLTVQHQRWLRRKINLSRSLKHIHVSLKFAIHGSDSRAR